MIDAKKELQYRLAVRMLTATELAYAEGLAREKYRPQTVWE